MKHSGVNCCHLRRTGSKTVFFKAMRRFVLFQKNFSDIGNDPEFCLFVKVWAAVHKRKKPEKEAGMIMEGI